MNQYSVLLKYPDWCTDWDGPETFYTYVSAHTVEAAIEQAEKECCERNKELTLDDLSTLLVIQGWHPDLNA